MAINNIGRRSRHGIVTFLQEHRLAYLTPTRPLTRGEKVFWSAFHAALGGLSFLILLMGYWQFWPHLPRFEFLESVVVTPEVAPGGTLVIRRRFKVNEPGGLVDIDREIRGVTTDASFFPPSTGRFYEVREYNTPSYVILPALPEGLYEYILVAEYKQNPIKMVKLQVPIVRFRVVQPTATVLR